jgi:hypothetical protein
MTRFFVSLVFFFILTTSQVTLLNYIPFDFLKADLGIPFILYEAFFGSISLAFWIAVSVGIIQEGFSSCGPGGILFGKISIFLFSFFMKNRLFVESQYTFGAICGFSEVLESLLIIGLSLITRGDISNAPNVLYYILPNATLSALFSFPIYQIYRSFEQKYGEREWE